MENFPIVVFPASALFLAPERCRCRHTKFLSYRYVMLVSSVLSTSLIMRASLPFSCWGSVPLHIRLTYRSQAGFSSKTRERLFMMSDRSPSAYSGGRYLRKTWRRRMSSSSRLLYFLNYALPGSEKNKVGDYDCNFCKQSPTSLNYNTTKDISVYTISSAVFPYYL